MVNIKSCGEFAHFLSNFITLKRKEKQKPGVLPSFEVSQVYPFFRELLAEHAAAKETWTQTATEIDVTFDFAIYLWSQKYNRKIEVSKNLPKCFSVNHGNFLYS